MSKMFRKVGKNITINILLFSIAMLIVSAWSLAAKFSGLHSTWGLMLETVGSLLPLLMVFLVYRNQKKGGPSYPREAG